MQVLGELVSKPAPGLSHIQFITKVAFDVVYKDSGEGVADGESMLVVSSGGGCVENVCMYICMYLYQALELSTRRR